jgi:hypothetical protein
MYYFQIVLRGLSFVLSFDFIFRLNQLFQNETFKMVLVVFVSLLEVGRLIYTIVLNREELRKN